jgi:hypothetical protein
VLCVTDLCFLCSELFVIHGTLKFLLGSNLYCMSHLYHSTQSLISQTHKMLLLTAGGKDLHFEKKRMDKCNVIICTPGRLLQHMDENELFDCNNLQVRKHTV